MAETLNIYQRISAVMADLDYVQKEDKLVNDQYSFVSHDAVSAAIHPLLVKHGIVIVPRVINWTQDGNRTAVDMEVDFVNIDTPEDMITVPSFGFGIDKQDKAPGKAVSYAVKYAALKLFVLATGDDPERDLIDHVADKPKPKTPRKHSKIVSETIAKQDEIRALSDNIAKQKAPDEYLGRVLAHYRAVRLEDLTAQQVAEAQALIEANQSGS